jgi:hypothetical protein
MADRVLGAGLLRCQRSNHHLPAGGGTLVILDGPRAESTEALGGFYLTEATLKGGVSCWVVTLLGC